MDHSEPSSRRYAATNEADEEDDYNAKDLGDSSAFCNTFWGAGDAGYEAIASRMRTAGRTMEEVRALYKERADIEADYAKRLSKLSKSVVGKDETGSTRQALEVVRTELDMTSRVHGDLAAMIKRDLEAAITEFQAKIQGSRRGAAASIEKLYKNKQAQETYVNKSRERYEQDCIKINGYTAQSSLVQGKDLDKVTSKLDKAQSTVQANEKDYQNFVRALKDTTLRWNSEWKAYLDQCQDMEEERLDFVKSNLWNYANAISAVCVADDEGCERIRVALENCDTPKDIASFIEQRGTGPVIPDPPEYINYARGQHGPGRPSSHTAKFVRHTSRPAQPPPPPSASQPQFGSSGVGRDGAGGGEGESGMVNGGTYQASLRGNGAPAAGVSPTSQPQPPYGPTVPPPGGVGLPGMVLPEQSGPSQQHQPLPQQHQPMATPPKPEGRISAKNFIARTPSLVNQNSTGAAPTGSIASYDPNAPPGSTGQQSALSPSADEDPIAKALANLRLKSGGNSPGPSQHQKPAPSAGGHSSTLSTSNHRHSQPPSGHIASPGPTFNGSVAVPSSPSAAFMQAPQRSHSPLPVEDVVGSYGQSFPGERKSISRQGSISSAVSTRVNVNSPQPPAQHAPQRGKSPAPPGEGFAGVGARGRSPSPQPYQGGFQQQSTPSHDGRKEHYHQAGQSSISAPQSAPQRAGTPLGISLDASGSVTHDQMAQEYMQRAGSVPPSQQQQGPPPPTSYQQQFPSQHFQPQQAQQSGYGAQTPHNRPGSVVQASHAYQGSPAASSTVTASYGAPSNHYQQGPPVQQQGVQYSYQQQPPQPTASRVPYNQGGAPHYHHQHDPGSAVGYGTYSSQQPPTNAVPPSHAYGPGRGPTPAQTTAPPTAAETAASAYMHQYQRQSSIASSNVGQSHEHQQQQPRWSQQHQGGAQSSFGPPNGVGYAPPQLQQHQAPPAPSVQQQPASVAPSVQQQQSAVAPTGQYSDTGKPILFYVKAMYDYNATTEEEFSFTLGDIIAVTQTDPDGWWQGELLDEARRKRGANTFPSNFTNLLT